MLEVFFWGKCEAFCVWVKEHEKLNELNELQEALLLKDQETRGGAISYLIDMLDGMEDLTVGFSAFIQ